MLRFSIQPGTREKLTIGDANYREHDQVTEVELGEPLVIRGGLGTAIASVTQTSGPTAGIADTTITPTETGRASFRIVGADGSKVDLRILVFDPACHTFISGVIRSQGNTTGEPDCEDRRLRILRSVSSQAEWFDGTTASLANRPLWQFGA